MISRLWNDEVVVEWASQVPMGWKYRFYLVFEVDEARDMYHAVMITIYYFCNICAGLR